MSRRLHRGRATKLRFIKLNKSNVPLVLKRPVYEGNVRHLRGRSIPYEAISTDRRRPSLYSGKDLVIAAFANPTTASVRFQIWR